MQAKEDLPAIIKLQSAIKFNAGGHLNHSIFWKTLRPIHKLGGDHPPYGDFRTSMEQQFGSFESMKEKLSAASIALQGSGWGWLGYDKFTGKLAIATCANQDTLEDTTGLVPLFGIDVWEHAYYLQVCRFYIEGFSLE
jgi:Fe-Mn family superoxide dismutase